MVISVMILMYPKIVECFESIQLAAGRLCSKPARMASTQFMLCGLLSTLGC